MTDTEKNFLLQSAKDKGLEWDKPLAFDDVIVPTFPYECLPKALSQYVKAVSDSTQTSIDMPSVAGLMCLAVCLQGKYVIEGCNNYKEPLNLFGVIIAKPGERKSSVMKSMTKYIYQYEEEKNTENQPLIEENTTTRRILNEQIQELESRAKKLKGDWKSFKQQAIEKRKELSECPEIKPLRLIADDVSPEALTSLLVENNGKMSVISAEGGIFDILAGRYSSNNSVNIDTFLKAHAGDNIRVDRRGRPSEYVNSPCLSILLSIQPQVLDGIMENQAFRGRGLIGRFLYSYPVSIIGSRTFEGKSFTPGLETQYKNLIYKLLDIPCPEFPYIIKLSAGAEKLIQIEFDKMEKRLDSDLESIGDWASKYIGAVLRIAGLIHIAGYKTENDLLTSDTMQNAIEIGHYFLEQAKLCFSIMGADKETRQAKYIIKYISKDYKLQISRRDIYRLCRGKFKSPDDMLPALELLCDYGYLIIQSQEEQEYNGTGRKKSPLYYINPYIYE